MSPGPIHDWSGFLPFIRISESISIPTYFLVISLSFCVAILWLVRRADRSQLSRVTALDLSLVAMISGFIGARLFHVIFESPGYYRENPLRILEFWMGGFVWYGGALAAALGFYIWARKKKLPLGIWLDLSAPVCSLGYMLGRIACLMTGCCFGEICHLSSGISFRHPTQLYAILWEGMALSILLFLESRRNTPQLPTRVSRWLRQPGQLFLIWISLHAVGRIFMESFRADDRGFTPFGLSISTWISLALIASSTLLIARRDPR